MPCNLRTPYCLKYSGVSTHEVINFMYNCIFCKEGYIIGNGNLCVLGNISKCKIYIQTPIINGIRKDICK